jgi:hypothetical protein
MGQAKRANIGGHIVMVTITNGELQVAVQGMSELMVERMSAHLAMKLRRMMRAASVIMKDVEEERQKLLKEFCKLDDKGTIVTKTVNGQNTVEFETPEKARDFEEAYQELMAVTSEQPEHLIESDFHWVAVSGEQRQVETSGKTLMMLGSLLVETPETVKR